jgi:ATP-dependent HslUV protease, peptidase subunit HslV
MEGSKSEIRISKHETQIGIAASGHGHALVTSLIGPVSNFVFRISNFPMKIRSTTILTVRHNGRVAMGGDGQVTMGQTIVKSDAVKIRKLMDGQVLVGFAGAAADAFALMERLEAKLKDYPANVPRAATELAKDWRMDRALRRLEALVAVVDAKNTLLLSGTGDVIQPSDGILGIGSGGNYALAAARALVAHSELTAAEVVRKSLEIAGDICVYSNRNIVIEELP